MPPSNQGFYGIKVSKTGIPVNDASDRQLVYKDDYSTKTYYDNSSARMLEGLLPDGTYGLWVSKPGFDVRTASATQLVFNSGQNVFKIITTATDTITATWVGASPGPIQTFTKVIAHGQSITPAILAFGNYPSAAAGSYSSLPVTVSRFSGTVNALVTDSELSILVDAVNITFRVNLTSNVNSGNWAFRYYLLQESAA